MPALVAGIHVLTACPEGEVVDGRDKPGCDHLMRPHSGQQAPHNAVGSPCGRHAQFGVIFPVSITVFQRAISAATNFASSSPLLPTTSKPTASNFAFTSGERSTVANVLTSLSVISIGVPAGAESPYHVVTSNPV